LKVTEKYLQLTAGIEVTISNIVVGISIVSAGHWRWPMQIQMLKWPVQTLQTLVYFQMQLATTFLRQGFLCCATFYPHFEPDHKLSWIKSPFLRLDVDLGQRVLSWTLTNAMAYGHLRSGQPRLSTPTIIWAILLVVCRLLPPNHLIPTGNLF
jgi:hypothetical protein